MTDTPRRGGELFTSGWYCAESVLLAVAEALDERAECVPGIATGLCSGVARTSHTCGAVSGMAMALGLELGRRNPGESVEPCYAAVQAAIERFTGRFGSTNCRELTGCDLLTDEGQRRYHDGDQLQRCREITEGATRIAAEILGLDR